MANKKNVYWTVKYEDGWLRRDVFGRNRKDAIESYLTTYEVNPYWSDKPWAWHKRNRGVKAVRVEIVEVGE